MQEEGWGSGPSFKEPLPQHPLLHGRPVIPGAQSPELLSQTDRLGLT